MQVGQAGPISKPANSFSEKVNHIWMFVKEIFIKDFFAVARCIPYNCMYLIKSNWYGTNPKKITVKNDAANIIMLIPGGNGKPFTFYPLAKKLKGKNISNVFTLKYEQTDEEPIPTAQLDEKIQSISKKCLKSGAKNVNVLTVGHCLGGVSAVKLACEDGQLPISKIVAIASRIRYFKNPFDWYCKNMKPKLEENFPKWEKTLNRVEVVTIRGDRDGLVPVESAHFQNDPGKEHTVSRVGHLGIMYSDAALEIVVEEIENWLNKSA